MAASDEISRVRYFDRQFLRAVDFQAEQIYERDARRRHVLAHHTWGIVVGFELVEVPITGQSDFVDVVLRPGLAIDGFGRELVSYHPLRLDPAKFDAFNTDAHQTVWLAYQEDQAGALSSNWSDCQDGAATRTTESWTIVVSPPPPVTDNIVYDASGPAPPTPPGAPQIPADQSVPYQELPEGSPGDRWLIRLGTVHWDGTQQAFRPAAAGRLAEGRTYAGAVAASLYAPASTLEIAPRAAPADLDADDFVTVDGRLRIKGRVNAEKDVWLEGGRLRLTYAGGEEDNTPLTLGREAPPGNAPGNILRLQIGATPDASTALTIGPGDASNPPETDIVRVRGDDVVEIPDGRLSFGHQTRQMIDLWSIAPGHQYGIGVQAGTQYFRSDSRFCWFKGGTHNDATANPGAGGQLQLQLDDNGSLQFGSRVRQMLNLWSTNYGIGVQDWTMYFRTDADFCWYRGGAHSDNRDDAGGGTRAMILDAGNHLSVQGAISAASDVTVGAGGDARLISRHLQGKSWFNDTPDALWLNWYTGDDVIVGQPGVLRSNMHVSGNLTVDGTSLSVVKVKTYEFVRQNAGVDAPAVWNQDVSGDFTQVFSAFAVLSGFSIWPNNSTNFTSHSHAQTTSAIPQHVYTKAEVAGLMVTLRAYCSESLASNETDNSILVTLVVIGRQL
jgi:hypothetical protein